MPSSDKRCPTCYLQRPECLCERISAHPCSIQVLVLRHTLEGKRSSNTGRLVARALAGAQLVDYGRKSQPLDSKHLSREGSWLLYPKPGARVPTLLPKQLIVLDGSWSQARKMAQRIPALWSMPTLALPPPAMPLPRLRNGLKKEYMSTAESVIAALRVLGQDQPAQHLETLLRELVRRFSLPRRRGVQPSKIPVDDESGVEHQK